jgi:O-antigen/teichoic acid export membrane protein
MSIFPTITASYIREKWQHAGFQKYFQNMGWAFSGKMFSLVLSFFVGALVARYLGPEKYGVLNYALSFVTIFAFLSSFGIDNILVRDLIKNKEQNENIINTSFVLKLIGGVLVILVSTISSFIFNDSYTTLLIFIYSLHLLFASLSVLDSYFQSIVKYKYSFIAQFISVIIVSIFKLILIYNKFGTGWFILAIVFDTLISSFILYLIFKNKHGKLKLHFDKQLAKKMLSDSWPFILTGAFFLIYTKIDQIMIGQMIDTASLGIYSVGVKLAEVWYFIPTIICGVLFPSIVNSKTTSNELYKKRIKNLLFLIIGVSFSVAFFEFIFAKYLVSFIFGSAYLSSVVVLRIYTWAGIMISIIMVAQQYLTIENKTKLIMFSSLLGAVTNIILNLIFIPKFGILGASYATLISYALIPVIFWSNLKITTKINTANGKGN